ncbi:NAD-P-binding protein [Irpex rosettiformis]|uniref:NAD-P-binding protein n=1 Tax=Irpex rosettiformis TaxID=378272 RepID=A0ACB8TPD2_9APHY|nr:NAD-P-binding protein [Irpex rosettiformis]
MSSSTATRVAFVTGGAQGIGEAIALRLAQDGLDVAVFDIAGKEELLKAVTKKITDIGRKAIWIIGDVTNEESIKNGIAKAVEELGSLDVMVANAGIMHSKPVIEMTPEEWNKVLAVNATGIMLSYKHAGIQMIKQGRGGRIIGACSVAGKQGFPTAAAYSASKFAVRGLTHAFSQEMKPHNITVNAYAPGFIATPMLSGSNDDGHGEDATPGQKTAQPSVVADLVSYLALPNSYFVNGQIISVDGGWIYQ